LLEDVYLPLRSAGNAGSIGQSRAVTLMFGIVMMVLSCLMRDVLAALTVAYDLLVGGLLVSVIGAIMWRRGTTAGALSSIAVGSMLVIGLLAACGIDSDLPIYVGLGASLIVYVLVSLCTNPARSCALVNTRGPTR
jgi:SSS family solute:Na+ symporter